MSTRSRPTRQSLQYGPGDELLISETITKAGHDFGNLYIECTFIVADVTQCAATLDLPNGQITTQGVIHQGNFDGHGSGTAIRVEVVESTEANQGAYRELSLTAAGIEASSPARSCSTRRSTDRPRIERVPAAPRGARHRRLRRRRRHRPRPRRRRRRRALHLSARTPVAPQHQRVLHQRPPTFPLRRSAPPIGEERGRECGPSPSRAALRRGEVIGLRWPQDRDRAPLRASAHGRPAGRLRGRPGAQTLAGNLRGTRRRRESASESRNRDGRTWD